MPFNIAELGREAAEIGETTNWIAGHLETAGRLAQEASEVHALESIHDRIDTDAAHAQFQENCDDLLEAHATDLRLRSMHLAKSLEAAETRLIGRSRVKPPREEEETARPDLTPDAMRPNHHRITPKRGSGQSPGGRSSGQRGKRAGRNAPASVPGGLSIPVMNRIILPEPPTRSAASVTVD